MKRPVLIYVTGFPPEPIAAAHGEFPAWFEALWRQRELPVRAEAFDGTRGALPPDPSGYAGVVLTGSPASMTEPEPWMEIAVEHIRGAAVVGTPVLGVCFGHQLIGAAYGGSVVRNPAGWHVGTRELSLTEAGRTDPLFRDVPERFTVNVSHADAVEPDTLSPRNGIRVLAGSAKAPVQAVAAGDAIRGVQFHPEFSGAITRSYVQTRFEALAADADARGAADEHPEHLLANVSDAEAGVRVFENWLRYFALAS